MFLRKNRFRATSQLLPPRTRVARNPSAKNFVFASGCRRSVGRGAQSEVVVLRSVVSLPSLAHCHVFCSSTFWFLGTCLFTASTPCRGISSMSAVSQWEPSAAIKLKPLRTDSIVFFFLWFTASIDGLGSKAKASAPFSTPFRGSGFRIPMGTLGIQTASLRASLAQAFAHSV